MSNASKDFDIDSFLGHIKKDAIIPPRTRVPLSEAMMISLKYFLNFNDYFTLLLAIEINSGLILEVRKLLLEEKTLLRIDPPVIICGDLHGQFNDLRALFLRFEDPNTKILFMGGLKI